MRKVKFRVSLGRSSFEDEVEFSPDTTDEEIQEHYLDWQSEHVDGGWFNLDE